MTDVDNLKSRAEQALAASGLSMKAASLQAGLGDTFVRDFLKRDRTPSVENLSALAVVLGVSPAWLMFGDSKILQKLRDDSFAPSIVPGSAIVSGQRMPVYAAAMGGDGHIIVSFDPIDEVKRPAELENVKGGYGLLVKGTSMVPAISEGDMALVNPHLPPARGKNVILYHTPPNGADAEAIVKQLEGWNDREWTLKQWNPPLEFKEYRQEWPICHRLVGTYYSR